MTNGVYDGAGAPSWNRMASHWNRRAVVAALLSASALAPSKLGAAEENISPEATPRDWSGQTPLPYPDPDVIALDPRFEQYVLFQSPI